MLSDNDIISSLIDITSLPMDILDDLPDTVLAAQLRRVADEAVNPSSESFAAFQSALSTAD